MAAAANSSNSSKGLKRKREECLEKTLDKKIQEEAGQSCNKRHRETGKRIEALEDRMRKLEFNLKDRDLLIAENSRLETRIRHLDARNSELTTENFELTTKNSLLMDENQLLKISLGVLDNLALIPGCAQNHASSWALPWAAVDSGASDQTNITAVPTGNTDEHNGLEIPKEL
nr:uncharacterized protein CTRU02_05433 [Colletotrichum truncatum]KAF6793876.1 hypothetical protein CTRU02_05433 [Colletotrichum truncatum]